ncbi:MAG: GNAT family N-acetyltransferase [Clostridia bacterium]|nr:GNAT family N-acetyltransferase [Clostridia bacterium]
MILETERLILRPWTDADAESLYFCAKDTDVGTPAGWPAHKSIEESLNIINTVFNSPTCFAICKKEDNVAIGSIEIKSGDRTDMTERSDECELGFWLGKSFWGNGFMPEAVNVILSYCFDSLNMSTVWCGYYDGNHKSKRVQEKVGFIFHHTCNEVPVPLLNEIRIGHTNYITKERWNELNYSI